MVASVGDSLLEILLGSVYLKYHDGDYTGVANNCGSSSYNSSSIDVLQKTCFINYDTLACIRATALVLLTAITGLLCGTRVVNLHLSRHPNYYQYAIFYLALIQCIVSCMEWILGWTVHGSLICVYLRCLELVVICHFYCALACRVTGRMERLARRLCSATLSLFLTYFTAFTILGLAFSGDGWCDCFANYWLFITGGQFVLVQIFVTAAVLIIHRVNAVHGRESFKKTQRRGVCILVSAFEISAITSMAYHAAIWTLATEEHGCSGVFLHQQWIYSSVRLIHELLSTLIPIWVMYCVFKPSPSFVVHPQAKGDTDQRHLIATRQSDDLTLMDPSLLTIPYLVGELHRRQSPAPFLTISNARAHRTRRFRSITNAFRVTQRGELRRTVSAPPAIRPKRKPSMPTIPEETTGAGGAGQFDGDCC